MKAYWRKVGAVSEYATRRARGVAVEAEEAAAALDDAEHTFEDASNELETLSRESS